MMDEWQMPMGGNGAYMQPGADYDGQMPNQVSASLMPHTLPRHIQKDLFLKRGAEPTSKASLP